MSPEDPLMSPEDPLMSPEEPLMSPEEPNTPAVCPSFRRACVTNLWPAITLPGRRRRSLRSWSPPILAGLTLTGAPGLAPILMGARPVPPSSPPHSCPWCTRSSAVRSASPAARLSRRVPLPPRTLCRRTLPSRRAPPSLAAPAALAYNASDPARPSLSPPPRPTVRALRLLDGFSAASRRLLGGARSAARHPRADYDSGVRTNELQPRHEPPTGRVSPEPPLSRQVGTPKYDTAAWQEIGKAIALAVLDLAGSNPHSRVCAPGGSLNQLRASVAATLQKRAVRAARRGRAPAAKEGDDDDDDDDDEEGGGDDDDNDGGGGGGGGTDEEECKQDGATESALRAAALSPRAAAPAGALPGVAAGKIIMTGMPLSRRAR